MATIFSDDLLKEFENFYRVIAPSLMDCNFYNKKYYFRSTKSNCRTIECEICKLLNVQKSILWKNVQMNS